ncbi:uncharacterized protein METZ01_LOCUS275181, partial [marine metagenome]
MLKKYLKELIIILFLIVISNNAYALTVIERMVGSKYAYEDI